MSILYKKIFKEAEIYEKNFRGIDSFFFENLLNKDFSKNNPYRNVNLNEGLNMPKPEINREKSRNINEQLKRLRERVGN